ncbi:MAG: methionine--tRNA ligase [Candidatus Altiarchaeota archaeon]
MTVKYLVTAALPYANGPVHVGHAIGAYIPADVYVRYRRLRGDDVLYICGTDEHGTPITVSAEQEGVTPKQVVEKYHKVQLQAFEGIGVLFDNFSGTAREIHHKISQDFFLAALKNGHVVKKTVERPFCPSCARFLPDRYVKGVCPNCDSSDQRGDQCEACGKQLEPHELKDAYCSICGNPPEHRETTHWFFKLSEFSGKLKSWIESDCGHWPANAKNFALGWIKEGLEDRAITRDINWGIPVPLPDDPDSKGKVLYVWFDAPIGYISSTKEWAQINEKGEAWRQYWTKPSRIIHFIGKDNIPFHTVIWPATLLAEGSFSLPWQIASNEFLNLEGKKVSTSRGWVIWLHDIIREFNPDAVRYYLLSIAPETNDSDFHLEEFKDKVNNELIATLGNFINRTLTFIQNKKDGIVPEPDVGKELLTEIISSGGKIPAELPHPSKSKISPDILQSIRESPKSIGNEIEGFRFKHALSYLLRAAQDGNVFFQRNEPWKQDNGTTLFLCANLVRSIAILANPFLPASSQKIWDILKLPGKVSEQSWGSAGELGIKPGHKIGKVETLYDKIEDSQIEEFRKKYLKLGETKKREVEKLPEVDYSEFEKIALRVGVVKSVEDHPNADKLYVIKVDLGELGERTLVAGVKESYGKDELAGKRIVVVANLKPVKIRGVESQGMLLAADIEGKPVLIEPGKDAPAGTKIR